MPPSLRGTTRTTWTRERLACGVLALLLTSFACAERASRVDGVASSAGTAHPPARETGGMAGGRDRPSDAGAGAGGVPEAGRASAEAPADPEVVPPEMEPPDAVGPPADVPGIDEPGVDAPEPSVDGGGGGGGAGGTGDAAGLPCDVQKLLRARCQSCHSAPPVEGAAISLLSYADLSARSKNEPAVSVAARCLKRMKDSLRPMPPAPANALTISEMTPLQTWLDAGAPPVECDETPSDDPYDASPTCSSGGYWTAIDSGSPWMNPGLACIKCHRQSPNFSPQFSVAGTVFATAHEPDKCFGVSLATGAQIVITDANGQELSPIRVVSGGNFGAILSGLSLPYRAKVVVGDRERVMLTPQTNGDCNACHTQAGAQGARGRIIVP